ncbi:hypothetical protein NECAME_14966 [Necator americanus]|uniref:DUF7802 domain-containing protein n=1 Tax=Necator americanus TaxID=51031 RepID=W2SKP2_NECAM|nr:hypothetical protein NECAME_14966 [Necator americanus]ETN70128.1 hypothetical protein NECAME_14966 [Necator americanus]
MVRRSGRFCPMDYLLDRYFFANLPFDVTPEARKGIGQKALTWADWFCKYESPVKLLGNNPYFLVAELLYVFFCALTFAHGSRYWFDELSCAITLQYIFLMVLVIIADPANIVSEGLHQAIGPCKEMESVHTPAGSVLQREKYLCATKYDEKYFDFHCVPNGIPKQARASMLMRSCCILFGIFFYQVAACSGSTPVDPIKVRRRAARQTSAISPEKNTVTVQTSPKSNKDLQFREPLISTKNDSLTTPFVPREILKETEVQEEENLNTTKKISHRRKREGIPSTTRVLRSRSYQVS